jgi:AbrB family looped-hinge helix DNA binding protein
VLKLINKRALTRILYPVFKLLQVEIPEELREKLGIKPGDRLLVRIERGAIILQPLRRREALERLESIADRYLRGPRRINAV